MIPSASIFKKIIVKIFTIIPLLMEMCNVIGQLSSGKSLALAPWNVSYWDTKVIIITNRELQSLKRSMSCKYFSIQNQLKADILPYKYNASFQHYLNRLSDWGLSQNIKIIDIMRPLQNYLSCKTNQIISSYVVKICFIRALQRFYDSFLTNAITLNAIAFKAIFISHWML